MKKYTTLLLFSLGITGCAIKWDYPTTTKKSLEERCLPLLERIMDIQKDRDTARADITDKILEFESGIITRDQFHNYRLQWLSTEDELRNHVTRLYDRAYRKGCL
tara:strand:- start:119 stop:433 length:315 start_codon:yes stop_codon:yes gene_type:complete